MPLGIQRANLPTYYSGPVGTNNGTIRLGGTSNGALTVSGNNLSFTNSFAVATSIDTARAYDLVIVCKLTILAGADTVVTSVSIDSTPGIIVAQANTAGYLAVIGYTVAPKAAIFSSTAAYNPRMAVQTTGTVPASGHCGNSLLLSRWPYVIDWQTATTTVTSAQTLTFGKTFKNNIIESVAINDVSAAQSFTYSGTVNNTTGTSSGATSTWWHSYSDTTNFAFLNEATGATLIGTWGAASTLGASFVGVVFNNDGFGG